eukprot:TRINITY_DN946_c0_g3_i1.p1 TRINITY_DN946_c0_g3~~TRINITY_DN946_c0_g3_i1.p1  ORF type:complete len:205 (-),score=25.80 TRINITY_DN946_c0_g3_i1:60-674(-)
MSGAFLPLKYISTVTQERCIKASKVYEPASVQHKSGEWRTASQASGVFEPEFVQHSSSEGRTTTSKTTDCTSISKASYGRPSAPDASQHCTCSAKQQLEITMVKNGVELCAICSHEIRPQMIISRKVTFSKEKPVVFEFEYVPPKNSRRTARALESLLKMKSRHPRRRYLVPEYPDMIDPEDEGRLSVGAVVESCFPHGVIEEC